MVYALELLYQHRLCRCNVLERHGTLIEETFLNLIVYDVVHELRDVLLGIFLQRP